MNHPVDLRKLVGMSEAAKKRAARKFAEKWSGLPWSDPRLPTSGTWEATKMFFRIGKRLAPCGGCPACGSQFSLSQRMPCDGTGVIVKPRMRS